MSEQTAQIETYFQWESFEHFAEKSKLISDDLTEHLKTSLSYFTDYVNKVGLNSFLPSIAVFNKLKDLVGIVVSRNVTDKDDLYVSLSEMLFFPVSVESELFILMQDARITMKSKDTNEDFQSDAYIVTFVTPDACLVYTSPYSVEENQQIKFHMEKTYFQYIHEKENKSLSVQGDLYTLLYAYSHNSTSGPFEPYEVLGYLKTKGFDYKIFHPENIKPKYLAVPIVLKT